MALAKFKAYGSVPTLGAGAGGHQISHTRQAGEGLDLTAHGNTQPGNLRQPSSDHRRAGVLPCPLAITHTCSNGNNVLQHAAHLTTNHVMVGVDPKQAAMKYFLHLFHNHLVGHGDNTGGGIT